MSYIDTDAKMSNERKHKKLRQFAVYRRGIVMSVHDSKQEAERAADYYAPVYGIGYVAQR